MTKHFSEKDRSSPLGYHDSGIKNCYLIHVQLAFPVNLGKIRSIIC